MTSHILRMRARERVHKFWMAEIFSHLLYMYAMPLHCVSKNDSAVARYNFNAHQLILVIFGRDIAERICY